MFSADLELNIFLVPCVFCRVKMTTEEAGQKEWQVVLTSFVPTRMGIHRSPAHVGSSLLLQCCCYNPRGNNPCSFE